ncbi:hypothetical protein C8Q79DRAFT_581708 [Trametes meyenii]|nr:hypothetical protein C8Q79DRAFT_581708 [Trametes meyenii]
MFLFAGEAWFSPCVPVNVKKDWSTHGGRLWKDACHVGTTVYLFCDGYDDPWFQKLHRRSLAVFHWTWIPAVIDAQLRLPIAPYAINGRVPSRLDEPPAPEYSSMILQVTHLSRKNSPEDTRGDIIRHDPHKPIPRAIRPPSVRLSPRGHSVQSLSPSRLEGSVPFVDLQRRAAREVSPLHRPAPIRITRHNLEPRKALTSVASSGTQDEGRTTFRRLLSAAASGQAVHAISVTTALESLRSVPTGQATMFVPGTVHLGREFRCFYVQ